MKEIILPDKVKKIIETLSAQGYEAYAVGGCVRDSILGRKPQDWDITTSARPEQVKALFAHTIDTGIQHGTVTVMLEHEGFEVTTYRIDGEYEDARHPKEVVFTANLIEDLKRRDFTINAMAYNEKDGIVDVFDGIGDLERGVIRCVGNAKERFLEDALRMLRAVRFAAQLGFVIEDRTCQAICELAPNIAKISAERIQMELVKLLVSSHPEYIRIAYEAGLTQVFLPEFDRMMQVEQNNPYHIYTVGEHTLEALKNISADKVLRLTMLLHDVAKPDCRTTDERGIDHFYEHQQAGADMAKKILHRLKFDNDTIDEVYALVQWHDDSPALSERNVRRAIHRAGVQHYPKLFMVKHADIMAKNPDRREHMFSYLNRYERIYKAIMEKGHCLEVKDLAVNGSDLIAAGMKQGRKIGEVLKALLERVLDEPELNTKEQLLALAFEQELLE